MSTKQFFWKLYSLLPQSLQRNLYPYYISKKNLPMPRFIKTDAKPRFCLSFDFELALGAFHTKHPWRTGEMLKGREAFNDIIKILEKHNIKSTWGVCGHLFLEECKYDDVHKVIDKAKTSLYQKPWLKNDPHTNFENNKYWYAPDLIEILRQKRDEIACHSFAHIDYSYVNREIAEADISECIRIAKKSKIDFRSFIFPYNKAGHLDLLQKYGLNYRSTRLFVGNAVKDRQILEIPCALQITKHRQIKNIAVKILEKGVSNGGIIHFWTHPWELYDKKLLADFAFILSVVRKLEDEGRIEIVRMKDIK